MKIRGLLCFPPKSYKLASGITTKGRAQLVGAGLNTTYLSSFATHVTVVTFDCATRLRGFEHLSVRGYYNSNTSLVTTNAVSIGQDVSAYLSHCDICYRNASRYTQGTRFSGATSQENRFTDCDFSGLFTEAIHNRGNQTSLYCVTKFMGCIVGAPIDTNSGSLTGFTMCELGNPSFTL